MIVIEYIKCWQKFWYNSNIEVGPVGPAFMYKSGPPQFWYYNCIFANIWYLNLLIQSIIIILRILMFYIQRVLADFEVEKTAWSA